MVIVEVTQALPLLTTNHALSRTEAIVAAAVKAFRILQMNQMLYRLLLQVLLIYFSGVIDSQKERGSSVPTVITALGGYQLG